MASLYTKLKTFFIPCSENGFAPNSLQVHAVRIMAVLVFMSFSFVNVQTMLWMRSDWLVGAILPAVIVDLTNDERTDGSVGTLKRNPVLDQAAQHKAEHMAQLEYFSHYSPDGISPWYWFDQVQYPFIHAGENLAVHFTDSDAVVGAWMNSPGHRANILNSDFTEIGVGTAKGEFDGSPTVYVVQLFGTPAVAMAEPSSVTSDTASAESETQPVLGAEASAQENREEEGLLSVATQYLESLTEKEIPDLTEVETPPVLYSDLATTSRQDSFSGTVVPTETQNISGQASPSVIEKTATQPSAVLQAVYGVLSLFVLVLLILSIVIEWRKQNPVQIVYGAGLLAAMFVLFYIHVTLTGTVLVV